MELNSRVRITKGTHAGRTATVTKVHGPKTVELRTDSGFMLWAVKVANLELRTA